VSAVARIDLVFGVDPAPPEAPHRDTTISARSSTASATASDTPALADAVGGEAAWAPILGNWLAQLQAELPPSLQSDAYSLGLQLVDDERIASLNRTWRQRPGPTDVLAFAAQEEPVPAAPAGQEPLELGDIVISLETARRQATDAGHSLEEELLFLACHGLLHLLGWDHPDEAGLAAMLERQQRLIEAI
jgi:probable rRNA maturation factor